MNKLPSPGLAGSLRLIQRGLSLIELMVALALSTAMLTVITQFFGPASANRTELENTARMLDNVAYAAELLPDEIRTADCYAEIARSGVARQTPDICATAPGDMG